MKLKIRTTLIAGAIAALIAGPLSAASDTAKDGAYTPAPTKSEMGQRERDQPTATQPMSETPGMSGTPYVGTTARTSPEENPLYMRSADDLEGMEVVDRTGDEVGDIKQIVLAPDRKSAHALISVGGIIGIGATDIMISLDDMTSIGDKLQMSATKAEATAQRFDELEADQYVEVKGENPISGSIVEFSAFEQGQEASKPGAASTTPKVGTDKADTYRTTPREPQ